jgi:hypothetical protein
VERDESERAQDGATDQHERQERTTGVLAFAGYLIVVGGLVIVALVWAIPYLLVDPDILSLKSLLFLGICAGAIIFFIPGA